MSETTMQVTVTLVGTMTKGATRSFVLEVPDDVSLTTLDSSHLEELADKAKIPWCFDAEGHVQVTDHTIDEVSPSGDGPLLPVISLQG